MAKNRRILPQKTVFWVRLSRLKRSLQILSKLFLVKFVKKTVSLHVDTWKRYFYSTVSQQRYGRSKIIGDLLFNCFEQLFTAFQGEKVEHVRKEGDGGSGGAQSSPGSLKNFQI